MMTTQQAFEQALQIHQAGRLAEAEALYRQILTVQPNHAEARHFLGVLAHQLGRHDLAIEWMRQALAIDPQNSTAHSNLGEAYRATGRLDEAIAACRRALELQPQNAQAAFNLANALRENGQLDEALAVGKSAVELHPNSAVAHLCLGNVLRDQDEFEEAIAAYQRSLALDPTYAEAATNLGVALRKSGRLEEAIAACRRALEIRPGYAEASNNLGNALRDRGHFTEAAAAYRQAIELDAQANAGQASEFRPSLAEAYLNLGATLAELDQLDPAIEACRRATELGPGLAEAHLNLGSCLAQRNEPDAALAAYRCALELKPDDAQVHINIGNAYKDQGQAGAAIAEYRRALELDPKSVAAGCNLIFTLHYSPSADARMIDKEHERWNRELCGPMEKFVRPLANDRIPDRPLRVGYVSGDFRYHVVGLNIWPLLRQHDRENFQIFCYAGVTRPDRLTAEFRERAEGWRNTVGVSDEKLAEMIRADGVDILVDLAQHTSGNRLLMFACRPAPVQVSFAGYPASSGVEAIRYRISDKWLEGGAMTEGASRSYARSSDECRMTKERIFLLDSFWCYDPVEAAVNELPARGDGHTTFGSLNNFCKVNDETLKLWACVLRRVPKSRLILLSGVGSHRQKTVQYLQEQGIDGQRVEFVKPCPRQQYVELYRRFDIVLDTFPYNGHTTSLDALWMGVPVVTLAGERPVSRGGLSQLSNLGLPELVAHSADEYVEIATRLAGDLPRLEELRRTLRTRMEASVLMDAPRFARDIEAAYRAMWREWCENDE